jgi:hypothetical protein
MDFDLVMLAGDQGAGSRLDGGAVRIARVDTGEAIFQPGARRGARARRRVDDPAVRTKACTFARRTSSPRILPIAPLYETLR